MHQTPIAVRPTDFFIFNLWLIAFGEGLLDQDYPTWRASVPDLDFEPPQLSREQEDRLAALIVRVRNTRPGARAAFGGGFDIGLSDTVAFAVRFDGASGHVYRREIILDAAA